NFARSNLTMLRLTAAFLVVGLLFTAHSVLVPQSPGSLTRLTNTPEHTLNLNPTLSDDGRVVVFESSADTSFHALRADLTDTEPAFTDIAGTRAVSPALSSDGKIVVFAATEDLTGQNADRNSEIFMFDGSRVNQLTKTEPAANTSRLSDGNFQPSVTADG